MALKLLPDHPYFLETRGQILSKLGRDSEAIRDLEKALKREELAKDILPTRVQCYRNVGSEVMEFHYARRLAELQ